MINDDSVFVPVVPLMEKGSILSRSDLDELLKEHTRSLDEEMSNLNKIYSARRMPRLTSIAESVTTLVNIHTVFDKNQCNDGLAYVEDMLLQQLLQAIGTYRSEQKGWCGTKTTKATILVG